MNKILMMASCALVLAACTPKTTPATDSNSTVSTPVPVVSKSPEAMIKKESTASSMVKDTGKYTFKLAALNNSKQDGTVTLMEVGGKVKVSLEVANASTTAEPAHIHMGKCAVPEDVKYPLTNVVNGKSETMLPADVTLDKLMAMGDLSINVHKSATELKSYTACGNLDWKPAGEMLKTSMAPSSSAKASNMVKASATASPKMTQ